MSRKLETIQTLKAKLIKMHKDLEDISAKKNSPISQQKSLKKVENMSKYQSVPISHLKKQAKRQQWKNPTFWGESPIVYKQNKITHSKWKKNKPSRQRNRQLSPKLTKILKQTDSNYYNSRQYEETLVESSMEHIPAVKNNATKSKRYENSFYGLPQQNQTPRFQKIKTYSEYQMKKIFQQSGKISPHGRKIIKPIERSSPNILTDSPNSNPLIYYFKDRQTSLSPQSHYSSKKNISPNMKKLLSPEHQMKARSPSKSQKKHFTKYFSDTINCNWH